MTLSSKIAIVSAMTGLSLGSAPLAIADESVPEIAICGELTEVPTIVDTEEPTVEEEIVDEKVTDEKVTDEKAVDEEITDEEVTEWDGEVPIDWVIRGGNGGNPEIYYSMTGGAPTSGPAANVSANDAGKDGAPTAVEAKTVAPVAPVAKEKKGPVALVKGARVFLRH